MAGPPPLLREDRLTLVQLGRMAREFDQISRGEHWPATRFVKWLQDEYAAIEATYNRGPGQAGEVGEAA